MIGYARGLLVDLVLTPQADLGVVDAERLAYVDPDSRPLDVEAQELDVRAASTAVVGWQIGGSVTVRHTISVALDVAHGDPAQALRLRDAIVLDLVLRYLDPDVREAFYSTPDPAGAQEITRLDLAPVDYAPLGVSDTNESAVLTFVLDAEITR